MKRMLLTCSSNYSSHRAMCPLITRAGAHRRRSVGLWSGQIADVLLAFDGNKAIGLTSVYADIQSLGFGPKCWLQDMVVDKERRSEGIGGLLMSAAEDWARGQGLTHIELSSNSARVDAHRFYERQGFGRATAFLKWLG